MANPAVLTEKYPPGLGAHDSARMTRHAGAAWNARLDEASILALAGRTPIFPHPETTGRLRGMAWHVPALED